MKSPNQFLAPPTKKKTATVAITSLMDALTIILIFLLVNYSESADDTEVPSFIVLPTLQKMKLPEDIKKDPRTDILLVVGKDRIAVDGQQVTFNSFDIERDRVLEETTAIVEKIRSKKPKVEKKPVRILLQADQSVHYEMIDSIVVGAAAVGITNLEFIASKEQ